MSACIIFSQNVMIMKEDNFETNTCVSGDDVIIVE